MTIPDDVILYSRYGNLRTVRYITKKSALMFGHSLYTRGAEGMFDFEGGPCLFVGSEFLGQKISKLLPIENSENDMAEVLIYWE